MPLSLTDPYLRTYRESPVNDLIVFTHHAADKGDSHPAFQGSVSVYVTLPPQLREIAVSLSAARDAAASHDDDRMAEQKALMEATVRALDRNSYHIILFADHHKDPSLLSTAGYEMKPPKTGKVKLNLLDLIPGLSVKHLKGVTGALLVYLARATSDASVELQMTETPEVEGSWQRLGEGNYNRSRFEIRGNQPARRIYIRARYHEDGAVGGWCPPVSIIVL